LTRPLGPRCHQKVQESEITATLASSNLLPTNAADTNNGIPTLIVGVQSRSSGMFEHSGIQVVARCATNARCHYVCDANGTL
jgi:hypothetical protein